MLLRSFIMRCLNGVAFAALLDADGTEIQRMKHDDFKVRLVITDVAASASLSPCMAVGEEEAGKHNFTLNVPE